jgi:hypothetical protein
VVGVEPGFEHIATFHQFAMPAVLAEGFFNGEDLA